MPSPQVWGKFEWFTLHCEAATFPEIPTEKDRRDFVEYLIKKARFLPCGVCGKHMAEYLELNPVYPHTVSREAVERYMYDFHESVNDRRKVPVEKRPTFEEVREAFSPMNRWPGLGGYPMESEDQLMHEDETTKKKKPTDSFKTNATSSSAAPSKSYLWIVLVLAILMVGGGAVGAYFFLKNRKTKNTL